MTAFSELLLQDGLVSQQDLDRAESVAAQSGGRLASVLARLGLVGEQSLVDVLSRASGLERAVASTLACDQIDPRLNIHYLRARGILPLQHSEGRLTLAMADPTDETALRAIRFATTATEIRPLVAAFSDIEDALRAIEGESDTSAIDIAASDDSDLERLQDDASEAPFIRLVNRLLGRAVKLRASDLHIEPMLRYVSVRLRIDGRLQEIERLPEAHAAPIASRIKVMSSLDISETRLPQDGRLRFTFGGRDVDVRVSTSPTSHGESIVLRLLGRAEAPLNLDELGLPHGAYAKLTRALDRPHGIVLLTGPTGSGKTTTLYAALSRLRRPDVKILTVEDPVEMLLEGVNQVQVRPEIDLSYAATLRAFLRQDPDILMIGEIRDQETAEIAMRAALTGHLVLSTLHTNSALGAYTRLEDIGVEPYLTASTVLATVAQRLVRMLCASCKSSRAPDDNEQALYRQAGLPVPACLHDAIGCDACSQSGYVGRRLLIEVVDADETLKRAIRDGKAESVAAELPVAETLLGHGLALVAEGATSLAEVQRAVHFA